MPAPVRIFGLQLAPWIPCQMGPNPKPTVMNSRSGFESFSCATAVETSVAPGVIDAVFTTVAPGAAVFRALSVSFWISVWDGELSVRMAIFLYSGCFPMYLANASPTCLSELPIEKKYGHFAVSVYSSPYCWASEMILFLLK